MPSNRRQINFRLSKEDEGLLERLQEAMKPPVSGAQPPAITAVLRSAMHALARELNIAAPPKAPETRGRKPQKPSTPDSLTTTPQAARGRKRKETS